jgi:hypothetical protein
VVDERPTFGYRRVTALANRLLDAEGKPTANHKRVFRVIKLQGLLFQRHTGRRKGRLHDGKVVVMRCPTLLLEELDAAMKGDREIAEVLGTLSTPASTGLARDTS